MNRENFVYDVVIIGGGFSGLVSAISLLNGNKNLRVVIIEKENRVGKKILSTGNGRCNLSNAKISQNCPFYHSNLENFSQYAINKFGLNSIKLFFENLGVLTTFEEDKLYPVSKQASSVLDALRFKVESLGIKILTNFEAVEIFSKNENYSVKIKSENEDAEIYTKKVILATGGKSSPHLGSDGSGYKLYQKFSHKVTKLYPAICQLKTDNVKGLKGLKQESKVTAFINNIEVASLVGDLLFTDYGVSGNTIFYLSSYVTNYENVKLVVDFCPEIASEELLNSLNKKIENCSYLKARYLLLGLLHNKLAEVILKKVVGTLSDESNITIFTKSHLQKVVELIKNYPLKVTGNSGFNNAQVTKGGLDVSQFDSNTMQSKLKKGLYAIGEVLDVDGDCGGYNLHFAYSSSQVAVEDILKNN